jgi:hypothetical protein
MARLVLLTTVMLDPERHLAPYEDSTLGQLIRFAGGLGVTSPSLSRYPGTVVGRRTISTWGVGFGAVSAN